MIEKEDKKMLIGCTKNLLEFLKETPVEREEAIGSLVFLDGEFDYAEPPQNIGRGQRCNQMLFRSAWVDDENDSQAARITEERNPRGVGKRVYCAEYH